MKKQYQDKDIPFDDLDEAVLPTALDAIPSSVMNELYHQTKKMIIIFAISLFFDAFLSFALVAYAFRGIQVCVVYLIFSAGLKMLKSMKKTVLSVCIVLAVASCMIMFSVFAVRFSSILYILICGCIGLIAYFINALKKREEGEK